MEIFEELSKRRSIGKFTTLVQVPEVANVQVRKIIFLLFSSTNQFVFKEFVAPMTAVAGSSTKAELTIKV